ncbi:MAG: 50S ribosomal protein L25 [Anaerolineae bacterium]
MAFELQVEPRQVFGKKVKALRDSGYVPAEIYGREIKNQSIQVPVKQLRRTLEQAGNTNLISIKVGRKKPIPTLARNIQYSPIKQDLLHVDFYAVVMTDTVSVNVPIIITGQSDLVKQGGTLFTGINSLEIEALPGDIPETIEVDTSGLVDYSDAIHVSDLNVPPTVTVHSSPESLVATVQPPRVAEEIYAAEGEEVEVEVEGEAEAQSEAAEAE